MGEVEEETQYFSKDFDWEDLKEEIEKDSSLHHHFLSFEPISTSSSPSNDSDAWKSFHNRHSTGKFFKERRYLLKEFPELLHCDEDSKVLEVGCGNGSTVLPILRDSIVVYACDCSTEALDRAKETIDTANGVSTKHRLHTFCCDLSLNGLPDWLICNTCRRSFLKRPFDCKTDVKKNKEALLDGSSSLKQASCCVGGVNFVTMVRDEFIETRLPDPQRFPHRRVSVLHPTDWLFRSLGVEDELCSQYPFLPQYQTCICQYISKDVDSEPRQSVLAPLIYQIFTLSAVQYKGMPPAIAECFDVLKPGGLFLFRDYGLYDMTMLRFQPNQRVGFREYMRSDGTRSYFFCLDTVRNLFVGAGFIELELEYCCVKSVNRRNRKIMRRVWVHGKFQKPI